MIPKPPEHVVTITDAARLGDFVDRMRARDWIAVDTEFLRERTYYPKLCLVQIADTEEIGLIDVLAFDDLAALDSLLTDPGVCKVFHSVEQDLEVLFQRFGRMPQPLFDTQIAGALVGLDDQMGYARMIKAVLDIDLAKSHTRTDWSKRPLPAGALDYAADDVRYLAAAYPVIVARLAERSRAHWLDDDFAALSRPERYTVDTGQAWRRIKSWHRLTHAQQQALGALADWREREAMAANRPRRWILSDDALITLARNQPGNEAALQDVRALPAKTAERHGQALLAALEAAREREARPLAEPPQAPDDAEKRRIGVGMRTLTERAQTLGIAAGAIASRKDVAALVKGERDSRLLRGWRAAAAGDAVLAAIENAEADTDPGASC